MGKKREAGGGSARRAGRARGLRETPPAAAAFRIHLKSSVDSAQGSAPVARALGEGAREARPGASAMMVAADRGLFWRGSCNDAIPRPASRLRALLLPFLNVPLQARRRFAPSTRRYFSVFFYFPIPAHSACVPTRDRPGARVTARDEFTCKRSTFGSAGSDGG
ncbi:Mitogen-Activated Protein Kinase Kinase Kinase 9 [Manis pentadactyla]|nr:Mitogen-Activated Protein Kinase Kinase Kinase 9 [Manis pentadactyla]